MQVRLIAAGTRMPEWIEAGVEDYVRRLPRELKFEIVEVAVEHRGKNADIARMREAEGERMLKLVRPDDRVIAFDERGSLHSTEDWAQALRRWQQDGRNVCMLVGGPDGLAPACHARAEARWSLSKLTFPHALVRVLLAEQLYRAWSLLNNHPYHRP